MSELLWIGSILGAVVGVAHAVYLWRAESQGQGAAIYRGLWAIGLWTLFGTYVLVLWVVGVIVYGLSGFWPDRRKA
jgi:hypothetical protein